MSETMTEAPVYKATTFGNMNFNEVAETPQETVATEIPTETPVAATTEAPVTEVPTEQVAQPQEENVSTFNLGESVATQTTTQETTVTQPTFNWKEEIKKLDKKEVAKELGLNDFALEIDEYLAKGGSAKDYIEKKGYDWNKVSDEELVKGQLKNEYPDATTQQIDRLYNKKYTQRDEDIEEDREDGVLLMKSDARRLRDAKIAEQNSFKIPEAIIPQIKDEAYEQWKQMQETQPVMMEKLTQFYETHDATKNLYESKRVAISLGEGVAPFNFSLNNPEALTRMFTDGGETWSKVTSTKTGEPDVAKQHLIGLFSFDPAKYSQDIFNYGVQMGKKKLVEEGQNAQRPQQKALPQEMNGTASYSTGKFGDKQR